MLQWYLLTICTHWGYVKLRWKKKQGCTCESIITRDDLNIVTHWRRDSDNEMWPKVPTVLKYVNIHESTSHYPYCIYALWHENFASSLTDKDKKKFYIDTVTNDKLFTDYATKLEAKKTEATCLQKKLGFHEVVPKGYIDEQLSSFQNKVTQLISPVASISGGSDQVVRDLQNTIQMFVSKMPILEVKEERQMNTWFEKCLTPILQDYGYKMSSNFPENKC